MTDGCPRNTDICMRTTLQLDDRVVEGAKRYAAREGTTLTAVIERALRQFLAANRQPRPPFKLSLRARSTGPLPGVDLDDRDALYERMDGRT